MMVIGNKIKCVVRELCNIIMEIDIMDNGKIIYEMDMER